jgi:hypothetical protein
MVPTGINTWTHQRPNLTDAERAEELVYWRAQAARPEFRETLWREVARQLAAQTVRLDLERIHLASENRKLAEDNRVPDDLRRDLSPSLAGMAPSAWRQIERVRRAFARILGQ